VSHISRIKLQPDCGARLDIVIQEAISISGLCDGAPVRFKFNGTKLIVTSADTIHQVIVEFHRLRGHSE